MGLGLTGGVSFMLQASGEETPKDLERVTNDLLDKINKLPGTMYARSAYEANTPQLFLNIDREKAQSMHVPVSRIFTTLQSKLASMYINDFNLIGYTFKVKMQSAAEDRTTINDIMNTYIQNDQGQMVPLSSVATLSYMVGPRQISRFNQLMSAEVTAQAKPGVSSGELMNQIEAIPLPENYSITWTDMSYQERQNDGKIVLLMGMALLFGYLFLVAQYESWTVPISVIVSVSVALLGALLGLIICNTPLSIYAQLGLVMLVGLAGKNAILMVEFSKMERERGVPIQEAALEGARQRFPRRDDDGHFLHHRGIPHGHRLRSGRGKPQSHWHLHLLRHDSRYSGGHSVHSGPVRHVPALPRMGERPVCQKGGINVKEKLLHEGRGGTGRPVFFFFMLQRLPRSYGQERLIDLLVQIQVKIFKMFLQDDTLQPVLKRRKKSIRRIFPLYFGNPHAGHGRHHQGKNLRPPNHHDFRVHQFQTFQLPCGMNHLNAFRRPRRVTGQHDVLPAGKRPAYALIRFPAHQHGVPRRNALERLEVVRQMPGERPPVTNAAVGSHGDHSCISNGL